MKKFFSKICFLGVVGALALNAFCSCEDKPIDVNTPEDPFISDADTILIDGEYPVPQRDSRRRSDYSPESSLHRAAGHSRNSAETRYAGSRMEYTA